MLDALTKVSLYVKLKQTSTKYGFLGQSLLLTVNILPNTSFFILQRSDVISTLHVLYNE